MPSSVVAVEVEKETWPAKLPSEYTPSDMRITEYFVRGTQPTEISDRYAKINDVDNLRSTKVDANTVTLTWDYDIPNVLTEEYINAYFTSSTVFGKDIKPLIKNRLEYNSNKLGDIVFAIYSQDADDNLTLLDTVTENTYTYTGYGNVDLLVVAAHEKFKANASKGIKISLNLPEEDVTNLTATLKGSTSITTDVQTYTENGFKSILYGDINVINSATIEYQVVTNSTTTSYDSVSTLESYINSLPAGTYKINYIVTYLANKITKTRNLTLK